MCRYGKYGEIVAVAATITILLLVMWMLRSDATKDAERIACAGHLSRLQGAINLYHQTFGTLPPVFIEDKTGNRLYSWRVLARRFLDDDAIYVFDDEKSWNAPANAIVLSEDHDIDHVVLPFVCPSAQDALTLRYTNYVAIVGEETLWPGKNAYKPSKDDYDKILLIELPGSDIKWTEPRDISVEEAVELYREAKRGHIRAGNPHLLYITLGGKYGDVSAIPDELTFRRMITVKRGVETGVETGTQLVLTRPGVNTGTQLVLASWGAL